MTDGIRPIGPLAGTPIDTSTNERREGDRRGRDRRQNARSDTASDSRELVPVTQVYDPPSAKPAAPPPVPPAAFSAQIIGQSGQKRGLKGGAPILDAARDTYLGTEYSGKRDRRPRPGGGSKTEI